MANYTGNNQYSGWTEIRDVIVLRDTGKSWQVRLPTGKQEPFVPKSQFELMSGSKPMTIGCLADIKVKTWLTDKWDLEAKMEKKEPAATFEFDLDVGFEEVVQIVMPNAKDEPDDSFLLDYSKKQLIAACTAYRSTIQQMTAAIENYTPQLVTRLARDGNLLDGRANAPDADGVFPTVTQRWDNQRDFKEIGKQGRAVLKSLYVGQAMLEKMGAIEALLLEKRAEVAAELIASMDDDED